MDNLMDFLLKEVPNNAGDLNNSINSTLKIIVHTRTALATKVTRLFQDGESEFESFTEANRQLTDIEKYLKELVNDNSVYLQQSKTETDSNITKTDYDSCKVDETKSYNLDSDFSKKRPIGFIFDGKRYDVRNWNRLLVMVCEILNIKNAKLFQSFPEDQSMQGRTRKYFIREKSAYYQKVGGTDIWVLTNNDGSAICRIIMKMFEKYNIPITSMEIFLRADFSLLQNDDEEFIDENIKKKQI